MVRPRRARYPKHSSYDVLAQGEANFGTVSLSERESRLGSLHIFWVIHIATEPEENTHLGVVVQQTVLSFPGYVFRVVNGKPMLTHTIDTIQSSSFPPQQHSKKYI